MNAPILADEQGTPARPTRGRLDTALDSRNKDRALASREILRRRGNPWRGTAVTAVSHSDM
jgi:hypothetical protein